MWKNHIGFGWLPYLFVALNGHADLDNLSFETLKGAIWIEPDTRLTRFCNVGTLVPVGESFMIYYDNINNY